MSKTLINTIKKVVKPIYSEYRMLLTRFKIKKLLNDRKEIMIDVGGGDKRDGTLLTLDVTRNCDLYWKLPKKLPFPDNCVDFIYSSHTLEHFEFKEILYILSEFHRILKHGCKVRIAVPNAKIYIDMYCRNTINREFFTYKEAFNNTTSIDAINYIAYMDGHHKYMFDGRKSRIPARTIWF